MFRKRKDEKLSVGGQEFLVETVELPFREGVELRVQLADEQIRVSDRGLGEQEAWRLLQEEIERRLQSDN